MKKHFITINSGYKFMDLFSHFWLFMFMYLIKLNVKQDKIKEKHLQNEKTELMILDIVYWSDHWFIDDKVCTHRNADEMRP